MKRATLDGLESRVAQVEASTGVQVVVALIDKADTYLELPWRAFALGASLGAFAAVLADALSPAWWIGAQWTAAATLGAGATLAIAALRCPPFARLFLRDVRRDAEVRHYAESMFLRRELFATRDRDSVLILVARFERKVEILADVGLRERVSRDDWSRVIAAMTPPLAAHRYADAFRAGLGAAEALLVAKGFAARADATNALSDHPIIERGART